MLVKQGLTSDATMRDRRMLESVIPYFEMENGKTGIKTAAPVRSYGTSGAAMIMPCILRCS